MKTSAQCYLLSVPCCRSMIGLGLLVLTLSGCSSSDPTADRSDRTAVSGTVTLDNVPVAGATVIFSPLEPTGKAASGITDAEGHFHLSTFGDKDGAIPGGYEVMLLKVKAEQNQVADVESPDYEAPMPVNIKTPTPESLIPPKYTNPKTSGLRATVPAEGELKGLEFQLTK